MTETREVQELIDRGESVMTARGIVAMRNGDPGDDLSGVGCEMERCFCPKGRFWFGPGTSSRWSFTVDHYPILKCNGGRKVPGNTRPAHRFCNKIDYSLSILSDERRAQVTARWVGVFEGSL